MELGAASVELLVGVQVVEGASVVVGSADGVQSADEDHSVVETSVELASAVDSQVVDAAASMVLLALLVLLLLRSLQRFVRERFVLGLAARLASPSCAARRFRCVCLPPPTLLRPFTDGAREETKRATPPTVKRLSNLSDIIVGARCERPFFA